MTAMSLGRAFTEAAARDPHRPAVTVDEVTVSRGDLEQWSNRAARAFAALGVRQGDYVTIALPNSAAFYAAVLATWKLGAVPQPVSAQLPQSERAAIVELADSRLIVGADAADHPDRTCLPVGWMPDPSLPADPLPDRISPSWKAPTSGGSTGRPKLIVAAEPGVVDPDAPLGMGLRRDSVMVVPGPMYHNAPFAYSSRGLALGNHVITMSRFDAAATLQAVERYRGVWMLVVPTMMHRITRLTDRARYDVSSLEVVWHMAAPCAPWLKHDWIDWLGGERLFELYAGTEAQSITVIRGDEWLTHQGSVGRPIFGEMRIQSPTGDVLPAGEVGEVYMRAPNGRHTYFYVGADAKVSADGWESLGDMGWIDAEGYLYLTDRLGDMILSGGANIYPAEIEGVIDEHPAVHSSAVVGLPDDDMGTRVHAIVHLRPGAVCDEAELRGHLAVRLVRYKLPRTFEFSTEPMRDDAGKVRRGALRDARLGERRPPAHGTAG